MFYIRSSVRLRQLQDDLSFDRIRKIGTDLMGVIDPNLWVYEVESLRVVAISIMPSLIKGYTNAPFITTSEKAADLIKATGCVSQQVSVAVTD